MTLDLNSEEKKECLEAYVFEFNNSRKGPSDYLYLRIRLSRIGLDKDEINDVIKSVGGQI